MTKLINSFNEDDEVLIIKAMKDNGVLKELDEYDECSHYQMLYEYFTSSYFTAI